MQDLQSIIDNRAEKKLEKEMQENPLKFFSYIKFKELVSEFPPEKFDWNLSAILYSSNAPGIWMRIRIKEQLLPQYISTETELFLKEIDFLKQRVAELNEDISFLQTA